MVTDPLEALPESAPVFLVPLDVFLLCVPIVAAGAIGVTFIGYELGLKEAWI